MVDHDYTLARGTHATPREGRCAMEWVSHLAGEPHSDAPVCVSPVLRMLCISLNDELPDAPRQRLRPYLARTIGTADDGLDPARAWMALDWLIRDHTPAWLTLAGLAEPAGHLATRPAILDGAGLRAATDALAQARRAARGARRAAHAFPSRPILAWTAARAAGRTGRQVAWHGPGSAARVQLDEGDSARAARHARAAAGDAAAVALARAPVDEVCGAAAGPDAARAVLGPTAERLTDSVLRLLDRMLVTEPLPLPQPRLPRAVLVAGGDPVRR